MINQSIYMEILIIDDKYVILIMLVVPKHILFNHTMQIMYNMEVHEDFLIIKWEKLPALMN